MKTKKFNQRDFPDSGLAVNMLMDSVTMAKYAIDNGMKIPEKIGAMLMKTESKVKTILAELKNLSELKSLDEKAEKRKKELESNINNAILNDIDGLTTIHGKLSELVSPATPRSIAITEPAIGIKERATRFPLFRNMIIVSIVCLVGYIFSKAQIFEFGALTLNRALLIMMLKSKILYQLHIVFAAGLGASFYILFTVNRYFIARTYDTKYTPSYWNRFYLGIIAGSILTNVILTGGNLPGKASATVLSMTPTLIALLGGFSTDAVYRILRRFVEMLLTLVRGETQDIIAVRKKEFEVKANERISKMKLNTAASLLKIYEEVNKGLSAESEEQFKNILDSLIEDVEEP